MPRKRTYKMGHYILDAEDNPIPWPDQKVLEWARIWQQQVDEGRTRIKQEYVGRFWVSTVFLGLDHSWPRPNDTPHIYETMVFMHQEGDEELGESVECVRSSTKDQALMEHEAVVNQIRLFENATAERHDNG